MSNPRPEPSPRSDEKIGLTVLGAVLSILLYVALAYVIKDPGPTAGDLKLARWMQGLRWRPFASLMWGVSALGFPPALPAIPLCTAWWLWWVNRPLEALGVLASTGGGVLAYLLKLVETRPRPQADLVRVSSPLGDYSFPSIHVATYTGLCGFLGYLGYVHGRSWFESRFIPAVCGLIAVLMGPSRIYHGHHWATDVLGGYLIGLGHLLAVVEGYHRMRRAKAGKAVDPPSRPGIESQNEGGDRCSHQSSQ